ncbi:DUF881 domain-containing protein [Rhodococcus sp. HNM0569]|uniref:DUF881 domain-containing protein n=1 Tax=Rhodococcus sp. HNM0569 TaxID=2716340 RepID=UPI00146C59B2|nr:DUF881 domain-containing protein [Rhodococcus sp. HNM0569]NLU84984.1 DUF881 domain-containing protein [Rhodococcus sp. HNM0569]
MNEHLDPGYQAAADDRARGHRRRFAAGWLALGALLIGFVLAGAAGIAADRLPGTQREQAELRAKVGDQQDEIERLDARRAELSDDVDAAREQQLAGDAHGAGVLGALTDAEAAAGVEPVEGPGIAVTLSDPTGKPDLSDSSARTVAGRSVVLDRDLQVVVNSLWQSGAEAVAVDGVRIGPGVTIRQAGGAMLVDTAPVFSPYRIEAIGPSGRMQTAFVVSDAYLRSSSLAQLYGVGFTVSEEDDLKLPAATGRDARFAHAPSDPGR